MKTTHIIAVIAMLLLVGCSHAPIAVPVDLAPAIASVDKVDASLTHAIKSNDKKKIVQQVQSARQELAVAKKQILSQQALADQLAATRDWWKNHSAEQDTEIVALKKKLSHFNHLLFLASSLAGILAGLVIGRLAMAFSPYGVVLGIGAGAITFGAVWAILAHL